MLAEKTKQEADGVKPEQFMLRAAKLPFYNTSPLDMPKLLGDRDNIVPTLSITSITPHTRAKYKPHMSKKGIWSTRPPTASISSVWGYKPSRI